MPKVICNSCQHEFEVPSSLSKYLPRTYGIVEEGSIILCPQCGKSNSSVGGILTPFINEESEKKLFSLYIVLAAIFIIFLIYALVFK